jgi:multiple sugar transport system permease protein
MRKLHSILTPFFYCLPALIITSFILLVPLLNTFYRSFLKIKIGTMEVLGFIGLGNYINIINDSAFRVSFLNSLILGFAGALPAVLVALLVASVSNQQFRGSGIILSLIVAAWAIPPIVAGRVWRIFFLPNGLISTLGSYLGLCERSYSILGDPSFALISVIIASIWKFSPFATLILFGGMRTIPPELYEAAKIDGATFYRTFRHITLPLIARYFSIAVLFVGMYMAATVDLVYALTGGGPGYATEILASYTYKVYFLQQDFGKGGATSIILIMWSLISVGPLIYFISKQMFGRE